MTQSQWSATPPAERKRRDRIMLGRAFIVAGVIWMVLVGPFAFFMIGFGDCFAEDAVCQQGHMESARVIEFLPYLASVAFVTALLALRFRLAQLALLAIGAAILLFVFAGGAVDHGLILPVVDVPIWRLLGAFIVVLPAAAMWILGSLLMLLASRQPRTPTPGS